MCYDENICVAIVREIGIVHWKWSFLSTWLCKPNMGTLKCENFYLFKLKQCSWTLIYLFYQQIDIHWLCVWQKVTFQHYHTEF